MTTGTKVLVRPTSDSNVREYHIIGQEICDVPYADFFQPLYGAEERFSELGSTGKTIAQQLMDPIQAKTVERISFRPESVRVRKLATADWATVEKTIVMPALKSALDEQDLSIHQYADVKLRQLVGA